MLKLRIAAAYGLVRFRAPAGGLRPADLGEDFVEVGRLSCIVKVTTRLRPVPEGQAVCDDLNATHVAGENTDVHVSLLDRVVDEAVAGALGGVRVAV